VLRGIHGVECAGQVVGQTRVDKAIERLAGQPTDWVFFVVLLAVFAVTWVVLLLALNPLFNAPFARDWPVSVILAFSLAGVSVSRRRQVRRRSP
jgi:hypothetical protein